MEDGDVEEAGKMMGGEVDGGLGMVGGWWLCRRGRWGLLGWKEVCFWFLALDFEFVRGFERRALTDREGLALEYDVF